MTSIVSPALHRDGAVGLRELLDRNQAFGLVSEIDDHVFVGDLEDVALQQFAFVRRGEMTVVVDELLVVRIFGGQRQI